MKKFRDFNLRLIQISVTIGVVLIGCGMFLFQQFQRVSEQENWVNHTRMVINELNLILSGAQDAEIGVRGYLDSDKTEFLRLYEMGNERARDHLENLSRLIVDNHVQVKLTAALERSLSTRRAVLESSLESYLKNSKSISESQLKQLNNRSAIVKIREQIESMKNNERVLLRSRHIEAARARSIFIWALYVIFFGIGVVIILAFTIIVNTQKKIKAEALQKGRLAETEKNISELAQSLAGDFTLSEASHIVLNHLFSTFDILAGKVWVQFDGRLKLMSMKGVSPFEDKTVDGATALPELAREKDEIWHVKEVPENYWKITSGFGESIPNELVFIPVWHQGSKIGVIELAAFDLKFDELSELMNAMISTIGAGLNSASVKTSLEKSLLKTQEQAEELQAQQEELRTSNEELEQQTKALESHQSELNARNLELEKARIEIGKKAKDLAKNNQYKSDFLAKMSHELRTPLNGLLLLSTLLYENKEKNLTDQQLGFVDSIKVAGDDLLMLINDILDLSKIEAKKLKVQPEIFPLGEMIEATKAIFEPQVNEKGLKFIVSVPDSLRDLSLKTDRQRLEQILRNFLSNAIKFTEEGQIELKCHLNSETQFLKISVKDSGIGMPKEKQELIFEAFEQADGSVSRKYGGTGLGLTISRELASLLGGRINLLSKEGEGSTFEVEIPAVLEKKKGRESDGQRADDEKVSNDLLFSESGFSNEKNEKMKLDEGREPSLQENPDTRKAIMIVEDDTHFRNSVSEVVRSYGFKAIEASDGEEALEKLEVQTPDAILLDIKLPGLSGLGVLEIIKQKPHLRHLPVHVISGLEYQANALKMGALGYLKKPVSIDKIDATLKKIESQINKKLSRVLLIEDDERQRMAIMHLVGGEDVEVVTEKSGQKAIEKIELEDFDCVILDLILPDISGFDFLEKLNSLSILLPPIIIYTGKELSDEESLYLRKFSESIVVKGVKSPERLLDEVNLFLHRVESSLPESQRKMLVSLRSREEIYEGKTVLVVDDDIRNVFALTSALESKGMNVLVARDGIDAIESVRKNQAIDIVLMDIMMPRMDGYEAISEIRKDEDLRVRSLPIIALTAKAMKNDHEKCMQAGANDYLTKPINFENLLTVLKVWSEPVV